MRLKFLLPINTIFLLFLLSQPALSFDFSLWDTLLQHYVAPTTINGVRLHAVAYTQLAKDRRYRTLIQSLENANLNELRTREEQLAFWINAYNIMAVKMVIDHYPLHSIKDAGSLFTSVWKKDVGMVGGKTRTLHEIEHDILRKMKEPRIHAAIVCASVSCPDLRREAYLADKLNDQLDDQMTQFLANPQKGLRLEGETLYLSSIFDWFEEDFESQGGVIKFLIPYVPPPIKHKLKSGHVTIKYLDYDWALNEM